MAEFNPSPNNSNLELILGKQTKQRVGDTKSSPGHSLSNVDQAIKYSHIFPQLDIIASSRHIKTLFKIPFSKEPFSLAVHRIGKTLIFDDFFLNLRSNSSSTQPTPRVDEPKRERKKDQINFARYSSLPELTSDTPNEIQKVSRKKLVSFDNQQLIPINQKLDQSLVPIRDFKGKERQQIGRRYSEGSDELSEHRTSHTRLYSPSLILSSTPQPLTLTTSGDLNLSYGPSLRDILWRFEDYSMLLGCDLPIFGMGTYPAVSLLLQDARMPINVLTGIDLWLDNLMNNVPEVLMAYHVENVIRNYEVLDNDSIPTLPNSKFSPDLISNICANILHFLKANCTKEGHTYWLLRERGEDIIKLYDLTSLVHHKREPHMPQQFDNPFVDPVALLFYKVAAQMYKNLSADIDTYPEELGTIKHMLEQVIRLLALAGHHSKLELTAYQLLTDIFLSLDFIGGIVLPESETACHPNKMRRKKSKKSAKSQASKAPVRHNPNYLVPITSGVNRPISWPVDNILTSHEEYATIHSNIPTPIRLGSHEERARVALDYIISSLELAAKLQNEGDFPINYVNEMLIKAVGCFYILGQSNFTLGRLGRTLRFANYGLRTIIPVCNSQSSELVLHLKFSTLELTGDALCLLAKSGEIPSHIEESQENAPELDQILSLTPEKVVFDSFVPPVNISLDRVASLLSSIDCYQYLESQAKKSDTFQYKTASLMKRLGNAYNEIGLMSIDSIMNQHQTTDTHTQLELAKSAFAYFQNAIRYFKLSADTLNMVLVHSNCGRLMRICAFQLTAEKFSETNQLSPQWRHFCQEAISAYQSGIKLLSNGDNSDLCHNLKFELSNVKIQIVSFLIGTDIDEAETHELSQHLKSSISILEELVLTQFDRRIDSVFNFSLAYFYLGKIERKYFEEFLRNKSEKSKSYFHLSEKYFIKSVEILDSISQLENTFLIQKCKNYIQLHDLIMLNSFISKLQTKFKPISNALVYLSKLLSLFPKISTGDGLSELCELGEQAILKLRFIASLLLKQTAPNTCFSKAILELEGILGELKFDVLEDKLNFDSTILIEVLTNCERIIQEIS